MWLFWTKSHIFKASQPASLHSSHLQFDVLDKPTNNSANLLVWADLVTDSMATLASNSKVSLENKTWLKTPYLPKQAKISWTKFHSGL